MPQVRILTDRQNLRWFADTTCLKNQSANEVSVHTILPATSRLNSVIRGSFVDICVYLSEFKRRFTSTPLSGDLYVSTIVDTSQALHRPRWKMIRPIKTHGLSAVNPSLLNHDDLHHVILHRLRLHLPKTHA